MSDPSLSDKIATDRNGVVHRQSDFGLRTVCGQDRSGWSTAVTLPYMAGLALLCPGCDW